MFESGVLIVSYVPAYNRQGRDLHALLRELGFESTLVQLDGSTNCSERMYGVHGIQPKGVFHKFIMLWNVTLFCLSAFRHRQKIVVGVGRPSLMICAFCKLLFARKVVWYSLEYANLGRIDRWIYRNAVDAYIDVEVNRLQKVNAVYGSKVLTLVINNMPHLYKNVVKGGALCKYLEERGIDAKKLQIAIYAGSNQSYSCLETIVAASDMLPSNVMVVLMAYGISADFVAGREKCVCVPPVSGDKFYDWLADADCSLLPYESTTDFNVQNCSPQKIFDCYLAGVPYVASDRPIIRKTLEVMTESGRLCDFTRAENIVNAVNDVCRRHERVREEMMRLHRERFNYGAMSERVLNFFKILGQE